MKSFFRENPTIAFGQGLPLLLVIAFLLISGIPALLVESPQYDVLYATEYYNYPNGVQITVVNQKAQDLPGQFSGLPETARLALQPEDRGGEGNCHHAATRTCTARTSPATPEAVAKSRRRGSRSGSADDRFVQRAGWI